MSHTSHGRATRTIGLVLATVALAAATLVSSFGFSSPTAEAQVPVELITNGSFETGFAGWGTKDHASPFLALTTSPAGVTPGFGLFATQPTDGVLVANHGFDGGTPAGDTIEIWQDVTIPAFSAATLTFDWRAGFDLQTFAPPGVLDRVLDVVVEPAGGGAPQLTTNILTTNAAVMPINFDTGSMTAVVDLSAFAGQTVRVKILARIPQSFTGPAHMQYDRVSLLATSDVSIGSFGTPVCIETDLVQNAPEAAGLHVGNEFRTVVNGIEGHYQIIGGPTTCKINCLDGFDFNCDGVPGDSCAKDGPLFKVEDVAACLEEVNPSVPADMPTMATNLLTAPATGATAGAAASSAPVAAALPVPAADGPPLAATGASSAALAQSALALIGLGAGATAISRRRTTSA